jgi:hypothetical protein
MSSILTVSSGLTPSILTPPPSTPTRARPTPIPHKNHIHTVRVATATSAQIATVMTMADAAELRRSAGCTATTLWNSIVAAPVYRDYFGFPVYFLFFFLFFFFQKPLLLENCIQRRHSCPDPSQCLLVPYDTNCTPIYFFHYLQDVLFCREVGWAGLSHSQ